MYNGNYEVASLVYIYTYMYVQKRYFPLCTKLHMYTVICLPDIECRTWLVM